MFINGQLFSWADIKVSIFGRTVQNILAISYKKTSDKQSHVGSGREPVGYTIGANSYEASIRLGLDEVAAIKAALPAGVSLSDVPPFPIPVVYKTDDGKLVQHVLVSCMINELGADYSQGDSNLAVDLPLTIGGITGL